MNNNPSIWAVGRNYADHAKELNNQIPKEPFFFLKSGHCLVPVEAQMHSSTTPSQNLIQKIPLHQKSEPIHYEIELALQIKKTSTGYDFSHLALALDLTAREKQSELKKQGLPWTLAKSFPYSCPLSKWINLDGELKQSLQSQLNDFRFFFKINNIKKQFGNAEEMIFKPYELLSYAAQHFPIAEGDILLTGTPAGVGPLQKADIGEAQLRYKDNILIDWKSEFTAETQT